MNPMKMMPMISCREASRLLSENIDRRLNTGEKFSLNMHLAMCRGCSTIAKQIAGLRKVFRSYRKQVLKTPAHNRLSHDQKEQIKRKLNDSGT